MSDITISYKGSSIATMDASGTKTLLTEGKYCEGDIEVVYVSPGGGSTLGTKTITANGTYNASSDGYDGYSQVTANVPASAVDSGTKSIMANGNNQDVVGYAAVNVNVPNSYAAGDEGKVVLNGELVSQTSDTVTTNDTYDTTLINSLTVNVSSSGGGVLTGTITPTSRVQNFTFDVGTTSTINNLIIIPKSELPLKSNGKTFIAGIYTNNDYYKWIGITSNNTGSGFLTPSRIETGSGFSQSGSNITAYASRTESPAMSAGYFETVTYSWYAW